MFVPYKADCNPKIYQCITMLCRMMMSSQSVGMMLVLVVLAVTNAVSGNLMRAVPVGDAVSGNLIRAVPVGEETANCNGFNGWKKIQRHELDAVKNACRRKSPHDGEIDKEMCCPVLAAVLYSAHASAAFSFSSSSSIPDLPDDLSLCLPSDINIDISYSNHTSCDLVFCFCGIRLYHLSSVSCSQAFNISKGRVLPLSPIISLQRHCKPATPNNNKSTALCTQCVSSLSKIKERECQVMGISWLLRKNESEYMETMTQAMRATFYDGSCSNTAGVRGNQHMPLPVHSSTMFQNVYFASPSNSLIRPSSFLLFLLFFTFTAFLGD